MSSTAHGTTPYYYVPQPSRHPVMAAIGLFFVILGAGQWINGHGWGMYSLFFGLAWWLFVLYQWFSEAIGESEGGLYSYKIDLSFRWSMSWFIFSEVMFFAAFFGALYWARVHAVPMLGSLENALLWPDFKAVWPSAGLVPPPRRPASSSPSSHHGPVLAAHHQHRAAADLGRDADHCPPRAASPASAARPSPSCGSPWRWAPPSCVCRATNTCTPTRPEPQAQLGHLRLHLLHAHRLSTASTCSWAC
jgi:hypothetical protein